MDSPGTDMIVRSTSALVMAALLVMVTGCGQRGSLVYVLEEPQSVTLTASASAVSVQQGETVVLRVERRTSRKWQTDSAERSALRAMLGVSAACGNRKPPRPTAFSGRSCRRTRSRSPRKYRMDHTKIATMNVKGTITLTPLSPVKCEPDRVVEGPSIQIEVS